LLGLTVTIKSKILSPVKNKKGYLRLSVFRNGKGNAHQVHRLIALAFVPKPDGKSQVNHKNGVKDDNRAENLEWCTGKENMAHARHFLGFSSKPPRGENHFNAKLNVAKVRIARKALKDGYSIGAISRVLRVNRSTISDLKRGISWRHVTN
jgi:hypothetical protein